MEQIYNNTIQPVCQQFFSPDVENRAFFSIVQAVVLPQAFQRAAVFAGQGRRVPAEKADFVRADAAAQL